MQTQANHESQSMIFPSMARERLAALAEGTLPEVRKLQIRRFELRSILRHQLPERFGRSIVICEEELYRGSRRPGQSTFRESSVTWVAGLYLNLDERSAKSYAVNGTGIPLREEMLVNPPVLYRCSIQNLNLLDLRTPKSEDVFFAGFALFLNKILEVDSLGLLTALDRNCSDGENRILSDSASFTELMSSIGPAISSSELLRKIQGKLNGTVAEYLTAFDLDGVIDADSNIIVLDAKKVKILEERQVSPRLRLS